MVELAWIIHVSWYSPFQSFNRTSMELVQLRALCATLELLRFWLILPTTSLGRRTRTSCCAGQVNCSGWLKNLHSRQLCSTIRSQRVVLLPLSFAYLRHSCKHSWRFAHHMLSWELEYQSVSLCVLSTLDPPKEQILWLPGSWIMNLLQCLYTCEALPTIPRQT